MIFTADQVGRGGPKRSGSVPGELELLQEPNASFPPAPPQHGSARLSTAQLVSRYAPVTAVVGRFRIQNLTPRTLPAGGGSDPLS